MTELLIAYLWVGVALVALGVLFFNHYQIGPLSGTRKAGARLILAAPVWPLALALVLVKTIIFWVPRIWREAWS